MIDSEYIFKFWSTISFTILNNNPHDNVFEHVSSFGLV